VTEFWTISQIKQIYNISSNTIQRWCDHGYIDRYEVRQVRGYRMYFVPTDFKIFASKFTHWCPKRRAALERLGSHVVGDLWTMEPPERKAQQYRRKRLALSQKL